MAKRGRPRYPDILTPREWEVLALLREGASNEQIATRLEITERTAKYHVSEILGKLGVSGRQEAARWRPSERPWWTAAFAPLALWRKISLSWLSAAVAGVLGVGVAAGVALLVWGLTRTDGERGPQVAVVNEPGVYVMRSDGSDLRRLPSAGRRLDAFAWAPSGDRFTLVPGCDMGHELLVGTGQSPDLERVATLPESAYLYWSPVEDTIAASLRNPGDSGAGAVLIDLATGNVTPIEEADGFLGWSYDGRRFVIRSDNVTTIFDSTTGSDTELGEGIRSVLWSPTDDRLAFSYVLGPEEPTYDAWFESGVDVVNGDGSERGVLLPAERYGMTSSASVEAWSPDGTSVLVHAASTLVTATGTHFRFLVYDVDAPEQPRDLGETFKLSLGTWSGDGEHVAVERYQDPNAGVSIDIIDRDGESRKVSARGFDARSPAFSPDGKQLLYSVQRSDRDQEDLYLWNVDTGVTTLLAEASFNVFWAGWSADGAYIALIAGPVTSDGC